MPKTLMTSSTASGSAVQLRIIPMPSKSPKQARLMAAAAHDPKFAKRAGVPQKVAKEFNAADKGTANLKAKRGK